MHQDGFGNLRADGKGGAQRQVRLLEKIGHLFSPDLAHSFFRKAQQFPPFQPDAALRPGAARAQAHEVAAEHGFAAARLPDNGQRLPRLHAKRDAVYRREGPGRGFKADFEIFHFQQCHSSPFYTRMIGRQNLSVPHAMPETGLPESKCSPMLCLQKGWR